MVAGAVNGNLGRFGSDLSNAETDFLGVEELDSMRVETGVLDISLRGKTVLDGDLRVAFDDSDRRMSNVNIWAG